MSFIFKDIVQIYGNKEIFNASELIISAEKVTGLFGENGSGKTTFLNYLSGNLSGELKKSILFLDEFPKIYTDLFVEEIVNLYLQETNPECGEQKKVFDLLKVSDLYGFEIRHLSAGQLQRLKIYISLVSKKELIFFDEPFNTLDKKFRSIFIDLLMENEFNKTFLISGHQQNELIKVCDEFIFIENKKIFHKKQEYVQSVNEYVIKSKSRMNFNKSFFKTKVCVKESSVNGAYITTIKLNQGNCNNEDVDFLYTALRRQEKDIIEIKRSDQYSFREVRP